MEVCFNPLAIGSSVLSSWTPTRYRVTTGGFNPLAIGSSVLRPRIGRVDRDVGSFNPLAIGSSVLRKDETILSTMRTMGFNPLAIGSSVLRNGYTGQAQYSVIRFNPLAIGSSVLRRISLIFTGACSGEFQSPSNRVKCSEPSFLTYWATAHFGPFCDSGHFDRHRPGKTALTRARAFD